MLEIKKQGFFLDNKKINIYSGAMHYFRIPCEYWRDRLTKLKLAGFNTVETYVCWNLHEPKKGVFDFDGMLNLVEYLQIAKEVGLHAIVRPGPYICAEWDFGGLPAWLLKDKNMQIRCNHDDFVRHLKDFFVKILAKLNPMLSSNGGNIIAVQIENEYGSYGSDKQYLQIVKQIILDNGVNVPLFTSDGDWLNAISGGSLDGVYKVLNFGSNAKNAFKALKGIQDDAPKMCGEFWCGWFDHWGEKHHTRKSMSVIKEIKDFLAQDASFNIYMFHGGTNFNFWAGANHGKHYEPTVTSYDYCALLTEWGDYTPAYHAVREVLLGHQGLEKLPLLPSPKLQNIGQINFDKFASLFSNLENISQKFTTAMPESMEHFGQNFGMIYYETVQKQDYSTAQLNIDNVHDRAYVFVDDKPFCIFDRRAKGKKLSLFKGKSTVHSKLLSGFKGQRKIGVLVDAMGRINYGKNIMDRKGISSVSLGNQYLHGFDTYCLPLDNLEKLQFSSDILNNQPMFLKADFEADSDGDCFVHMNGFTKGSVWINGFNIGRFWDVGPQKALYIPGVLLKQKNQIVVLELEKYKNPYVIINNIPDLG